MTRTKTNSIMVIAGLYNLNGGRLDEVVYVRDDLDIDEVTNGFAASADIQEGSGDDGDDRLDADTRRTSVTNTKSAGGPSPTTCPGTYGVSDSNGDTKCTVPDFAVTIDNLQLSIKDASRR